ncbi:MAG: transposase [Clostridia bacterium]|nr:transposase [Clostridia bacterium]
MNSALTATLFVGIDVSSKTNYVYGMDFFGNKLLSFETSNNHPGAQIIIDRIIQTMKNSDLSYLTVATESTSFYSWHIANFISSHEAIVWFKPKVYCLNPKVINAYKKSFTDMDKTDHLDALAIADFARVGKIKASPWSGSRYIALQRLTRCRLHLIENISR